MRGVGDVGNFAGHAAFVHHENAITDGQHFRKVGRNQQDGHAAVGKLEERANSARRDLFGYAMADGYARMFSEAGFEDEVKTLRARFAEKDRDGAVAAVSNRMVQAIDFIGSEDEVTDFVRSYVDAGVEHPVLMPMPWGDDRLVVTTATMAAAAEAVA